jgi:hypothetical protein
MPLFRMSAAFAIIWLIQPEIIRAPIRHAAAELGRFALEADDPKALLAAACARAPVECARLSKTALETLEGRTTGAVKREERRGTE